MDVRPGDRRSGCRSRMEPIAVSVRNGGEWSLVHRCRQCGRIVVNRIAGDDNEVALLSIAVSPLARLPFPLDALGCYAGDGFGANQGASSAIE